MATVMLQHIDHDIMNGVSISAAHARAVDFAYEQHSEAELQYLSLRSLMQGPGQQTTLTALPGEEAAILKLRGWHNYELPAVLPVPDTTEERFGLDSTPAGDALAAAQHAQQTLALARPQTHHHQMRRRTLEMMGLLVFSSCPLLRKALACDSSCQGVPSPPASSP